MLSSRACRAGFIVATTYSVLIACGVATDDHPPPAQIRDGYDAGDVYEASLDPVACMPDPGKWDVPGNGCDEDGDGTADNPPVCDTNIPVDGTAADFAKTIGICGVAGDKGDYGLVSATFTRGYQSTDAPMPEQHAYLQKYGNIVKPREGATLAVLSSGYAFEYDSPNGAPGDAGVAGQGDPFAPGKAWNLPGKPPPGFPIPATGCSQAMNVNDVINVKLQLKAPKNALGFKFDFNFHSSEWPAYVCSTFNDGFIAYLTAESFNKGNSFNISYDKNMNPVSVNNGFFDRCTPGITTGCAGGMKATSVCPGGTAELGGTGFGILNDICPGAAGTGNASSSSGGATGWLTSQAPIKGGETFTLEFMVWDTGDSILDSLVLIDNFKWIGVPVLAAETNRPEGGPN